MNLADYEIQNEIANSDSSSDSFWVAKHVMTQELCFLKLELTKEHYSQGELENISESLKNLNHPSLLKLIDTKYDGEFLYSFWELPQGGTFLQKLFLHEDQDIPNNNTWRYKINEGVNLVKGLRKKSTNEPEFDSISDPQLEINKQKFSEDHLKEIMSEIAQAVKHLHLLGHFHGNLNISSLFCDEHENIKLGYISLNSNLMFTRHIQENENVLEENSEKQLAREKANCEYLKRDMSELQGLFLTIAKRNIKHLAEIDIIYSPHFRTFLFDLERKSYTDITKLIERIQEIGLNVREEDNNQRVQSMFYPEALEETKAEILDTSLQSISVMGTPHLKYKITSKKAILTPINSKSNIVKGGKLEPKTLKKDLVIVKEKSTRKKNICICILILIIIFLLGLNIWFIVLNTELKSDLNSTEKKKINAENHNEVLAKNITQLNSYISTQEEEIANLNKELTKINNSYNSLIIEKNLIVEDKEVLLKDIQNEIYINNILRNNIYQLKLTPVSIPTASTIDKYSPKFINENLQTSEISTQKKDNIIANLLRNNIILKYMLNELEFKYSLKIGELEQIIKDLKLGQSILKALIKETQNILNSFIYKYRKVKGVENNRQLYNIKTNKDIFQTLIEYLKHLYNHNMNYFRITSNKKEEIIQKENEISALQLQLHNSMYKNYWLKHRYQLGKLDNQYLIQRNYQQKEYYTKQVYSEKNDKINVYQENSQKINIYELMVASYSETLKVLKDQLNNQENKRESIQANTSVIKYSWLKNKYEALERNNEYLKQRNEYQIEYYSGQIYRVKNAQTNLYHTNRLKLLVYELIFLDYSNSLKLLKDYINNHQESHILQINSSQNQNYHWLKRKNQLMQSDKHYLARTNINQLEHCTAQIYSSKNRMNHFSDKTRQKILAQQEQLISFTNLIKVMKEYSIVQATEELILYMNYIKAKETMNINKDEIYYVKVQNSNYQSMLQYFAHLYYDMHYSRINVTLKEEIILLEDRIIDLNFQYNNSQNNIVWLKSRYQQIVGDNLYLAQGNADLKNDYSKNIFSLKDNKINKDYEFIQKLYSQEHWLRYYLSTIKEAKTKLNNQFNRGPILYSEYSSIKESNLQLKYKYLNRISEVIPSQYIFSLKTIETSNISRLIQDQTIIAQLTEDIKLLRNELAIIDPKVTYRGLYNVEDLILNLKNLLISIKYKGIAEIFALEEEKSELIRSLKMQKYERSIEMYYQIYQHEEILELREKIEHLVDIIKKNKEEHIPNFNSIKYLRDEYIACKNSNIQGADPTDALINELYIKTEQIANLQTERRKIEIYKNNLREMAGTDQFLHQLKINKIVQIGMPEYEIIFWSVHEYGILGWIEQGGSYTPSILSISSGYRHYKGEYNSDGYYVVGSTSGRPIVYNMKTAQLHKVYSGNGNIVYDCAWQNTTHFVCCDSDEDASFYEISTTNRLSKWSPGGDDKKAIIVLISGAVVVGDKDSDLDIKTTTNSYSSNTANEDDVYELAEVRPNMVISAEDDQLYLHNFTTPTDIRRTKLENDASDRYRSIVKLNATGEFAFGAKKDSRPYIEIKRLNTNNSTTTIKTYRFASSSYGYVYTLYELSNGFLLIGGSFDKICTWKYKDTPAVNPVCFDREINSNVVGFIPGSGFKYYLGNQIDIHDIYIHNIYIYIYLKINKEIYPFNIILMIQSASHISRTNRALSIYLQTDKPIYKPGDNILLQLLFVNPVSHTIECEESAFPPSDSPLKLHLKIVDGKDSTIYEDEHLEFQPEKKRMVFVSKWNIPNTQTGGIYRAIFSIIDHEDDICPSAERLFRIRQYFKQTNQVQVELDKESYFPRDIVNVKVFIKKGDGSPLSPDTQIFFTARIGETEIKGETKDCILDIPAGRAYLSFEIPSTVSEDGNLKVKIDIPGEEPITKSTPLTLLESSKIFLEFIPESGYLIGEFQNIMYFISRDKNGELTEISGYLATKECPKDVICEVETKHRGKGKFTFTPLFGVIYIVIVLFPNGNKQEVELPLCSLDKKKQVLLHTSSCFVRKVDCFWVQIYSREQISGVLLIISQKEKEIYSQVINLSPAQNVIQIDGSGLANKLFNGGVVALTLYADQQKSEILGEKLLFVEPADRLRVDVEYNVADAKYSPGQKVELTIQAKSEDNAKTHNEDIFYNVKVIDSGVFTEAKRKCFPPSLPAMLLLEDEILKDNAEHEFHYPQEYIDLYFTRYTALNQEPVTLEEGELNLELLLGTQNWRRYIFSSEETVNKLKSHYDNNIVKHTKRLIGTTAIIPVLSWKLEEDCFEKDIELCSKCYVSCAEEEIFNMENITPITPPAEALPLDVNQKEEIVDILPQNAEICQQEKEELSESSSLGQDDDEEEDEVEEEAKMNFRVMRKKTPQKEKLQREGNYIIKETPYLQEVIHLRRKNFDPKIRIDFYETVYFSSMMCCTSSKPMKAEFDLSDTIGEFTIIVEAFTSKGILGSYQSAIISSKPFYVNYDLPYSLIKEDLLSPQIWINNKTSEGCLTKVIVDGAQGNTKVTMPKREAKEIKVDKFDVQQIEFMLKALEIGGANLKADGEATLTDSKLSLSDTLVKKYEILSPGFPMLHSKSGVLKFGGSKKIQTLPLSESLEIELPASMYKGTLQIKGKIFPTPASSLSEALKSLLHEPCGCFEQTSSTTYPMVMALRYLKSHKSSIEVQAMIEKATKLLKEGYLKLMGYECKNGGYEWFGSDPGHEALTAYGLMQFNEMKAALSSVVDIRMTERVEKWEWLRRNEKEGGFELNSSACDSFGYAPKELTSAYIIYSLTEIGYKDIEKEMAYILKLAENSKDSYILSLAANALYNFGMKEEGREAAKKISQDENGSIIGSKTSITSSGGSCLIIETTSLAMLAFMKDPEIFALKIGKGMDWILKQQKNGFFGGTQSTILALKAIIKYDSLKSKLDGVAVFDFLLNGEVIHKVVLDSETILENKDLSFEIKNPPTPTPEKVNLEIRVNEYKASKPNEEDVEMPFGLDIEYFATEPKSNPECKLGFKLNLERNTLTIGEIAKYSLEIINEKSENIGMVVGVIRVPAAFEISFESLEKLKNNNTISHFEVISGNDIYLYWRSMAPNQLIQFPLFFLAKFIGVFTARASVLYEYYSPENKHWLSAQQVTVISNLK